MDRKNMVEKIELTKGRKPISQQIVVITKLVNIVLVTRREDTVLVGWQLPRAN
jgi:hypothetical protein